MAKFLTKVCVLLLRKKCIMRTKIILKNNKSILWLFTFIAPLFISPAFAQKKKNYFGISCSSNIAANRFGTFFCPSVQYQSGKNTFSIGINIQKERLNTAGFQFDYEYTLLDPCIDFNCNLDWLELYSFINLGYHDKAFLGKTLCEEELYSNHELTTDPSVLKLNEIHGYAGFGLRIILFKKLKWFNGIAIGGYKVFNAPVELFYNNKGMGLLYKTGLSYNFGRSQRGNF